jgi:hypothetical protein
VLKSTPWILSCQDEEHKDEVQKKDEVRVEQKPKLRKNKNKTDAFGRMSINKQGASNNVLSTLIKHSTCLNFHSMR